ncbi:MAG: methyltransferase domain-containing protein [Lachnospiraceae bacterium]|nr:methyltransferase domain-containing protein [Lachnospiraceae bacterium]
MKDNKSAYNSGVYDKNIINVLPYYREYHGQIIDLVRSMGFTDPDWLDTGCGTGTLAQRVMEDRSDVKFTLCDPSEKMLDEAKRKLAGRDVRFFNKSSQQITFESEFDVVTAVQCHHYLQPEERKDAIFQCYRALREKGLFVTFENIRMSTNESDAIALTRWSQFLANHGNSADDVRMHLDRRGIEVFPITIEEHIGLLRECGFRSVDVLWTSYLQAGFWAVK